MSSRLATLVLAAGLLCLQSFAGGNPLQGKEKIVVLIFISSDCPISNKLAPEIERLHQKFSTNGVALTLVYPNASDTGEKIAAHRRDYRLTAPFAHDPNHELAKKARATVTPEAAVFDQKRNLVYRGRITDQFVSIGKGRPEPTQHDLEEAVDSLLAGKKPKHSHTEAVGCYIQDR